MRALLPRAAAKFFSALGEARVIQRAAGGHLPADHVMAHLSTPAWCRCSRYKPQGIQAAAEKHAVSRHNDGVEKRSGPERYS